jgi:hypothetical protein
MKVSVLYEQGSPLIAEDTMVFQPPDYFGAVDGVSGIYLPEEGPRLFGAKSGGQLASAVISHAFASVSEGESLTGILRAATTMLRGICKKNGLSMEQSELLPSASFVVARVTKEYVSLIQGGDSLAVWQLRNGTIGATPNRVFSFEEYLLHNFARLMKKHRGDRQKAWQDFRPTLKKMRRDCFNTARGGFAILNGQFEFEDYWQEFKFRRNEISTLILFSDGLVPFEWTKVVDKLAEKVTKLYQGTEGLQRVLKATRKIAGKKRHQSHEDYPEATAVAIEF